MEHSEPTPYNIAKLEKSHKYFSDLLAVIHGDGGHYQAMHGDEKAFVDAIFKLNNLRSYANRLAYLLKEKP
jgi:hypothetical protein